MSDEGSAGPHKTVFRPSPLQSLKGGQSPAFPSPPPQPPRPVAPRAQDDVPQAPPGVAPRNRMMAAATPLFALLANVRIGRARIDLRALHREVIAAVESFDRSLAGAYSNDEVDRARYALAATADDVAMNLPNEPETEEWARRSIVIRFFGRNVGGDEFWSLLDQMLRRPAEYRDLLELYHAAMAAGFEGKYRHVPGGRHDHQEMMQQAFRALEHPRQLTENELSPHWRGHPTPAGKIDFWTPLAMAAAVAAAVLLVVYVVLRLVLAQTGQPTIAALQAINPTEPLALARVAPPAAPPPGEQLLTIQKFLAPEIAAHHVVVLEDASSIRVRTTVGQLFPSGSDQLDPGQEPLFDRIAQAVENQPGPVRVEGYTDSDRVNSPSFPDNIALSKARADTVAAIIRSRLTDASRVSAEGYGDADPVASNGTPGGKAQNRRVEIVIQKQG